MCDSHKNLGGKVTASYSGRNFSQELDTQANQIKQISDKRSQILKDMAAEISNLFSRNTDLKEKLGQSLSDFPQFENDEQSLLQVVETLRDEHISLKNQVLEQKQSVPVEKEVEASLDAVAQESVEASTVEGPVQSGDTPAKRKFWDFLKRK